MYDMVIWPAMTYETIAWHQPQGQDGLNQRLNVALAPFQNQCLQIITGAYQAAPASILEVETHVPPLNLYLDFMVARTTQHLEDSGMAAKIEKACQEVCCYLQTHDQNQQRYFTEYIHPWPLLSGWQSEWTQDGQTA